MHGPAAAAQFSFCQQPGLQLCQVRPLPVQHHSRMINKYIMYANGSQHYSIMSLTLHVCCMRFQLQAHQQQPCLAPCGVLAKGHCMSAATGASRQTQPVFSTSIRTKQCGHEQAEAPASLPCPLQHHASVTCLFLVVYVVLNRVQPITVEPFKTLSCRGTAHGLTNRESSLTCCFSV